MEQVYHSLSNASTEIASVLAEMSNTASNIKKYVKKDMMKTSLEARWPPCSTLVCLINKVDYNTGMFTETKVFVTTGVQSRSVPSNIHDHL